MPSDSLPEYRELLTSLVERHVEFILVGGLAATLHGSSRFTGDADIVYARNVANLERLSGALAPFAPYLRGAPKGLPFNLDVHTLKAGLNFTLATSAGSIDLLGEIAGGGFYDQLQPYSESVELFGMRILVLSLMKLIEVKRAAGRAKDFEAIAELEEIARAMQERDQ